MQCPNCSYKLVLLSNRRKYKCALCSKLYPQKEIDNKEFRERNKEQRKQDFENFRLDEQKRLSELKQIKKDLKLLFTPRQSSKEYSKKYYLKNKERFRQKWKEYYENNKEKELNRCEKYKKSHRKQAMLTYKEWLAKNKDKRDKFLKVYRLKNRNLELQNKRLAYWRYKQISVADAYLEKSKEEASSIRFYPFSPTFTPCELLTD